MLRSNFTAYVLLCTFMNCLTNVNIRTLKERNKILFYAQNKKNIFFSFISLAAQWLFLLLKLGGLED